ncbi:hypothetical protein MJH12_07320, partial [bacterium]|nr:hypothetical protein [bacterium]
RLLFNTFYGMFNQRNGFSVAHDIFVSTSRKAIFQTRKHTLMFDLLDYIPLAIESSYSYPFNIEKQKYIAKLSVDLISILRQITLRDEHGDRLNSLLNQYYRFFFSFLKREKIEAFESILKIFVVIMEARNKLYANSGFDGEMSEVYFSLTSKNKMGYKKLLQKYLVDSLKYSNCFVALFPQLLVQSNEELDQNSVLNETLKEVLKDGVIDETERKILLKVFSLLKFEKSTIKDRIAEVKNEMSKLGLVKESLNPKSLMLKILHVAFLDGKLSQEEKGLIQQMGSILGLQRDQMRQMIYEIQYASKEAINEPVILSVFTINAEFEKGISSFREESLQLEESARALSGLIKNNDLSLEGDTIDFGKVTPITMQVEIQSMGSELGLFFFVDKADANYLKELLKHLEFISVEEGTSSSKIILNLLSGKKIVIQQNEGIQIVGNFQEILNKNLGSIKVLLVDQKEQELINVFKSSYSIVTQERQSEILEILEEENSIRFQMFGRKMKRDYPGDRFWRTAYFEYVLKHDLILDKLRDLEIEYQFVCENDPEDFKSHFLMAHIFQGAGRLDDALKCYKRSILENPSYLDAILAVCRLLLTRKNQNELLFYFKYLEVYYWDQEEVKGFIASIDQEEWSLIHRNLIKTPFNLLFSTKKYS